MFDYQRVDGVEVRLLPLAMYLANFAECRRDESTVRAGYSRWSRSEKRNKIKNPKKGPDYIYKANY